MRQVFWQAGCGVVLFLLCGYAAGAEEAAVPSAPFNADSKTVLLLHCDEASWNGTAGEVIDSSGQKNHGQAQKGANTVAEGKFNRAGSFDGVDDHIEIADRDTLDLGNGNFTLEAWIRTTDTSGGIIWKATSAHYPAGKGYRLDSYPGEKPTLDFLISDGVNYSRLMQKSTVDFRDGNWHHVRAVRDGSTMRLYVDGIAQGTKDCSQVGDISSTAPLWIGASGNTGFLAGTIDEVRISTIAR